MKIAPEVILSLYAYLEKAKKELTRRQYQFNKISTQHNLVNAKYQEGLVNGLRIALEVLEKSKQDNLL